ncbi:antibiotic biosynthesis monooxygenase family protein [Acidicapsa dinghuensis]|uniref:Antibiotic biosynthesis monooxygenase family protein n=1 Tax=Acidicapsa dinghuensis TaxID=2218256 RepID=A0ABW1EQH2_9BACT|nr:antibiotic biosynthesis monooxygenase [Acidicapsa dinghuensis]
MIARVWHGVTSLEHADAYENELKPELLPGISAVPGYRGSYLLRRPVGDEVEFITIVLFDSLNHIRAVAGEDYENAIVPDIRRKYLLRWDEKAKHYEVSATHGLQAGLGLIGS